MGFWLLSIVCIILVLVVRHLLKKPVSRFPTPNGALPVLGFLKDLSDTASFERTLFRWAKELGEKNFEVCLFVCLFFFFS